jgi:L-fucose isomerase-like protein
VTFLLAAAGAIRYEYRVDSTGNHPLKEAHAMFKLKNTPVVKLALVGVSRDCFPAALTKRRLDVLAAELKKAGVAAHKCTVIIESEADALAALEQVAARGCNAAVLYLGNFGPEGPTTLFAERFGGPVMAVAAAEESKQVLAKDRGDALCGLLNCSYNLTLQIGRAHV